MEKFATVFNFQCGFAQLETFDHSCHRTVHQKI